MKVAYLINQYPKISHTFIRREIEALEARGIEVERFAIRGRGEALVDQRDIDERRRTRAILDVGFTGLLAAMFCAAMTRPIRLIKAMSLALRIGWHSDRGPLRHLAYVGEACVLGRWLRSSGAEHLHAHFATNSTAVAMFCRQLGGPPYSFTCHGPEPFDRPKVLGLDHKVARASFVATVCEFGRGQLYRWCASQHWPKIHVVRCGVDRQFLQAEHVSIPSTPRLVCVGRLSIEKAQPLLIEAVGRLIAEDTEVKLMLIGDGPLRGELERLIADADLADHVEIFGWASSEEIREQIQASRALVLPSLAEGLPVVIMEALALGRPVVTTFVAGIPELVLPGVCGWLVPAGSVDALTSAMREVLRAPVEQLEQMGRAGAARVAELHDIRTEAAKLAALFENGQRSRATIEAVS